MGGRGEPTDDDGRVRVLGAGPSQAMGSIRTDGAYVLYWMVAARRLRSSFALERAVSWARALGRPLVVFEPLRLDYPHASHRLHAFVLAGMAEHLRVLRDAGVTYYPYVEPAQGAGKGLLAALAREAAVVVSDDFPTYFLPRMQARAARELPVRCELVDSNGLLPMRATTVVHATAQSFRRYLQATLAAGMPRFPLSEPLAGLALPPARIAGDVLARWPSAATALGAGELEALAALAPDQRVRRVAAPASDVAGGSEAGRRALERFVSERLPRYALERNEPAREVTSGLSPWLHFGQLGVHEVLGALFGRTGFDPARPLPKPNGRRNDWWGLPPYAEEFLDQLLVWRELGFNHAALADDTTSYASLPGWARATLAAHAHERRYGYDLARFEAGATHDPIWNAAQRELVQTGRIHNFLRMLWGKKIVEWARDPEEALAILLTLNDRYALDGRDPNSYSGIAWCFGRYDHPWGAQRVFGTVRAMSSERSAKKVELGPYLRRFGPTR